MLHVMLFPMLNVLYFTPVLPAVSVWLFAVVTWCRALTVRWWGILWVVLRRFSCPDIAGIYFVRVYQMRCISVVRSSCLTIFSAVFLTTFLCPQIATNINTRVALLLSRIVMSVYCHGWLWQVERDETILFFFNGSTAPFRVPRPPHFEVSWSHFRHITLGRTPLYKWSARRRDLYLTTHNRQTSMP
jgi:hypothetical protein